MHTCDEKKNIGDIFRGEYFYKWSKIHEIHKHFLPRKFLVIWYICSFCAYKNGEDDWFRKKYIHIRYCAVAIFTVANIRQLYWLSAIRWPTCTLDVTCWRRSNQMPVSVCGLHISLAASMLCCFTLVLLCWKGCGVRCMAELPYLDKATKAWNIVAILSISKSLC